MICYMVSSLRGWGLPEEVLPASPNPTLPPNLIFTWPVAIPLAHITQVTSSLRGAPSPSLLHHPSLILCTVSITREHFVAVPSVHVSPLISWDLSLLTTMLGPLPGLSLPFTDFKTPEHFLPFLSSTSVSLS